MTMDILDQVNSMIRERLEVRETHIELESRLVDDLGFDSLGLVELVLAFEEAFHVAVPEKDAEAFRTVRDVVQYAEGLGVSERSPQYARPA